MLCGWQNKTSVSMSVGVCVSPALNSSLKQTLKPESLQKFDDDKMHKTFPTVTVTVTFGPSVPVELASRQDLPSAQPLPTVPSAPSLLQVV
jgi:hypothetical protein